MIRHFTKLGGCVLVLAVAAGAAAPYALAAGAPFTDDPKAAFALAKRDELPILIAFHTTWCAACEQMDRTTWRDSDVQTLLERVVALTVDGDRSRNLTARYDVDAYPTIIVAEPSGEPVLVLRGLQDPSAMQAHLIATFAQWDQLQEWAIELKSKQADGDAWLGLAEFSLDRGAWDRAERLFRRALRDEKRLPDALVIRARLGLAELLVSKDRCREVRKVLARLPPIDAVELYERRDRLAIACE